MGESSSNWWCGALLVDLGWSLVGEIGESDVMDWKRVSDSSSESSLRVGCRFGRLESDPWD